MVQPQLPGGVVPAGSTSLTPTSRLTLPNGFALPDPTRKEPLRPVPTTIKDDAPLHPWTVKADHGGWMIMVKSYAGPDSRQKAETLAADIRKTHGVNSLVYERNAEERKAEIARVEAVRKREQERAKPFLEVEERARREAEANGFGFMDSRPTVKVPRPYRKRPSSGWC